MNTKQHDTNNHEKTMGTGASRRPVNRQKQATDKMVLASFLPNHLQLALLVQISSGVQPIWTQSETTGCDKHILLTTQNTPAILAFLFAHNKRETLDQRTLESHRQTHRRYRPLGLSSYWRKTVSSFALGTAQISLRSVRLPDQRRGQRVDPSVNRRERSQTA
jgi:hypothetical protein